MYLSYVHFDTTGENFHLSKPNPRACTGQTEHAIPYAVGEVDCGQRRVAIGPS